MDYILGGGEKKNQNQQQTIWTIKKNYKIYSRGTLIDIGGGCLIFYPSFSHYFNVIFFYDGATQQKFPEFYFSLSLSFSDTDFMFPYY